MKKGILLNILIWMFRFSAGTARHNLYKCHLNYFSLHQLKTWALLPDVASFKVSTCMILLLLLPSGFSSFIQADDFCGEYSSLFPLFCLLWNDTSLLLYLLLVPKMAWASISRGTFPFKWGYIQIPLNSLTSVLQPCVILLRESPCNPDSFITHLNSQYVNRYFTKR